VVKIYTRSGVQSNIISYYIVCNISSNCLKNNMEHCASVVLSVITKNTNNNIIYTKHNNGYIDYVYDIDYYYLLSRFTAVNWYIMWYRKKYVKLSTENIYIKKNISRKYRKLVKKSWTPFCQSMGRAIYYVHTYNTRYSLLCVRFELSKYNNAIPLENIFTLPEYSCKSFFRRPSCLHSQTPFYGYSSYM